MKCQPDNKVLCSLPPKFKCINCDNNWVVGEEIPECKNKDNKLERMLKKDGWVLKYYVNCGVQYFAWHKNGYQIDEINVFDDEEDWMVEK